MRFIFLLPLASFTANEALADNPIQPDVNLTPGATFSVTASQVCIRGYAKSVRHVSGKTKHLVYKEYGIDKKGGHFEVDHLISLELGGSNDIRNLWPESYDTTPWNAHTKDELEDKLHYLVCHNEISLEDAQKAISTDWISAYKKYVAESPTE
jgi:hypothetical protein